MPGQRKAIALAWGCLFSAFAQAQNTDPKTMVIDDFTAGPWTWTLFFGQSIANDWLGLDKRHCVFGERQVNMSINNNPNQTSLTYSIGSKEQKFTSPLQVAWRYSLEYGNHQTASVNFSSVDRFMLDMYAVGGSYLPDSMVLSVTDWNNKSGTIGWNLRGGGVYFDKANFPSNIDWTRIRYLKLLQNFQSLPNPTTYCASKFYATLRRGTVFPGEEIDPFRVFRPD